MARPRKTYKRLGRRHKLLMEVHEQTWVDFKSWCSRNNIVPSELLEEYMAATVTQNAPLLDEATNEA